MRVASTLPSPCVPPRSAASGHAITAPALAGTAVRAYPTRPARAHTAGRRRACSTGAAANDTGGPSSAGDAAAAPAAANARNRRVSQRWRQQAELWGGYEPEPEPEPVPELESKQALRAKEKVQQQAGVAADAGADAASRGRGRAASTAGAPPAAAQDEDVTAAAAAAALTAQTDPDQLLRGGRHRARQPVTAGALEAAESSSEEARAQQPSHPGPDGMVGSGENGTEFSGAGDIRNGNGDDAVEGGIAEGDATAAPDSPVVRLRLRRSRQTGAAAAVGRRVRLLLPERPQPWAVKALMRAREVEQQQAEQQAQQLPPASAAGAFPPLAFPPLPVDEGLAPAELELDSDGDGGDSGGGAGPSDTAVLRPVRRRRLAEPSQQQPQRQAHLQQQQGTNQEQQQQQQQQRQGPRVRPKVAAHPDGTLWAPRKELGELADRILQQLQPAINQLQPAPGGAAGGTVSSSSSSGSGGAAAAGCCHVLAAGEKQSYVLLRALSYNQELLRLAAAAATATAASGSAASPPALGFTMCGVGVSDLRLFWEETTAADPHGPLPQLGASPPGRHGEVPAGRAAPPLQEGWLPPASQAELQPAALATVFVLPPLAAPLCSAIGGGGGGGASGGALPGSEQPPLAVSARAGADKLAELAVARLRRGGYCRLAALGRESTAVCAHVLARASGLLAAEGVCVLALPHMSALAPQPRANTGSSSSSSSSSSSNSGSSSSSTHTAGSQGKAKAASLLPPPLQRAGVAALPDVLLDQAPQLHLHLLAAAWREDGRPQLPHWALAAAGPAAAAAAGVKEAGVTEAGAGVEVGVAAAGQEQGGWGGGGVPGAAAGAEAGAPVVLRLPPGVGDSSTGSGSSSGSSSSGSSSSGSSTGSGKAATAPLVLAAAQPATDAAAEWVYQGLQERRVVEVEAAGLEGGVRLSAVLHAAEGRLRSPDAKFRGALVFTLPRQAAGPELGEASGTAGSAAAASPPKLVVQLFLLPAAAVSQHLAALPQPHPGDLRVRPRPPPSRLELQLRAAQHQAAEQQAAEQQVEQAAAAADAAVDDAAAAAGRGGGGASGAAGAAGAAGSWVQAGADTDTRAGMPGSTSTTTSSSSSGSSGTGSSSTGSSSTGSSSSSSGIGHDALVPGSQDVATLAAALTAQLARCGVAAVAARGAPCRALALLAVAVVAEGLAEAAPGLLVLVRAEQHGRQGRDGPDGKRGGGRLPPASRYQLLLAAHDGRSGRATLLRPADAARLMAAAAARAGSGPGSGSTRAEAQGAAEVAQEDV